MKQPDDAIYWLAINDKRSVIPYYLLDYIIMKYESLTKFWYLTKREIMDMGFSDKDAESFINYSNTAVLGKYRETLSYLKKNNIKIIRYVDDEYPDILKISGTATKDPPILLFRKGHKIDYEKSVGIVGTREASEYAKIKTRDFSKYLAENYFWIISGLAFGIDIEAHIGALEVKNGKTIAVLPWMDPLTPKAHEEFMKGIIQSGCIVSERLFRPPPSKDGKIRYPFIERNRITSGLSNIIIAVESGPKGGTIRQADFARAQKKPLYTLIPKKGSGDKIQQGFNLLVKRGAIPIHDVTEISDLEKYDVKKKGRKGQRFDPSSYQLTFGYDKVDATKRYIEKSKTSVPEDKLIVNELNYQPATDYFSLKYYLIYNPERREERPPCPRCGSDYIESRGRTWHCLNCNKYFIKEIPEFMPV